MKNSWFDSLTEADQQDQHRKMARKFKTVVPASKHAAGRSVAQDAAERRRKRRKQQRASRRNNR